MQKLQRFILPSLFLCLLVFVPEVSEAQCAMCKATAEQSDHTGLNLGIMVLFFTPYLVIGTVSYLWWKNRKDVDEPIHSDIDSLKEIEPSRMN